MIHLILFFINLTLAAMLAKIHVGTSALCFTAALLNLLAYTFKKSTED